MHRKTPIIVAYLSVAGVMCAPLANAALVGVSGNGATSRTPISWSSDPALKTLLGQKTEVDGYTLRLPIGYAPASLSSSALSQIAGSQDIDAHLYRSARSADGGFTNIFIVIGRSPADDPLPLILDDCLDAQLQKLKTTWNNFFQTARDTGQIGNLSFERVYFEGWAPGRIAQHPVLRMSYVAFDDRTVINMMAENVGSQDKVALAVADASILTFRRR